MQNNNNNNNSTSFLIVMILSLVFCFPVGIILLFVYILGDKSGTSNSSSNNVKYSRIKNQIEVKGVTSIKKIATNLYLSTDKVTADIENMIKTNYLPNMSIDYTQMQVVRSGYKPTMSSDKSIQKVCNGCGATNTSGRRECEYCGSSLT